jgi:nicotinamidase-related amidase
MPRPHPERRRDGVPSVPAAARHVREFDKCEGILIFYIYGIEDALDFVDTGFSTEDPMPELQLNPKKTALVIIDLNNAILGFKTAPYTPAQVVENSKKLAEAFRTAGAPVVYVTVDLNNFLKHPVDQPFNLGDRPIPAVALEIAPSAGFRPGDILVTKRHWGAFAGTDLEQQLKARGVDTVVLTGISTNAGVESTARQGTGHGFAFVLVEDACAGQDAEEHRFAFEKTFPRLARVRATDEVIAGLV